MDVAQGPAGRKLFVRQSSGLVREVSVANALFFNTAAFVGAGVTLYPAIYSLAFLPVGVAGLFTSYGWAAIIVGVACIFLGLIYASLTSVMPRSGGDYVFTSRFIPKAGPFIAWLESFTLVFASLAIIAFEVPLVLRNLQVTGRIVGIGTSSSFFQKANHWFASGGVITSWPGLLGSLLVIAVIVWVVLQPTRRLHRIVTGLAVLALGSAVLMFVFGLGFINRGTFEANLPKYAGTTAAALAKAAAANGIRGHGIDLHLTAFAFFMSLVLFNYIGFQYSAYIAGEVRGNIKRSIILAVIGALVIAIVMNSVYTDFLARRLGLTTNLGWGIQFWLGSPTLPMGQPNSLPLLAAIAKPGLWPIWTIVSLGGTLFPFLLCPVYINFISRIELAWSLDRQVPEWFGEVNERLRAPINAIITCLVVVVILMFLQNFPLLPHGLTSDGSGKLNLAATAWFSILLALLTWVMPGVNALVAPFSRKDLIRSAPWRAWLPFLGAIWLVFSVVVYWFAGIKPIISQTKNGLSFFNQSGISFAIGIAVVAIVVYVIQAVRNRRAGVDLAMLYQEIPPD